MILFSKLYTFYSFTVVKCILIKQLKMYKNIINCISFYANDNCFSFITYAINAIWFSILNSSENTNSGCLRTNTCPHESKLRWWRDNPFCHVIVTRTWLRLWPCKKIDYCKHSVKISWLCYQRYGSRHHSCSGSQALFRVAFV